MPLLATSAVSKSFGGVTALAEVSFTLERGEIHALVGENGAGKSTLIKILSGALRSDAGTIQIDGMEVREPSPESMRAAGIAVIYQQPALFAELSVAENIGLHVEPPGLWRRVRWRDRKRRAAELLAQVGASIDPETPVRDLSMPQQQLVEIAKALGIEAKVLILDEPTASLTGRETDRLMELLRGLRAGGKGIVYVSHRLPELFALADRATVLRDGRVVESRAMRDLDAQELIRLMVGREVSALYPQRTASPGDVVLEARGLGRLSTAIQDVSFSVRAGEILGVAGLVGSGRTEMAEILFGLTPSDGGEILLSGKPVRIDSPAAAVRHGIAYAPEDRRKHGAILPMPVAANTTLASLDVVSQRCLLNAKAENAIAARLGEQLQVKTPSVFTPVGELSGGNQQKVVLAKWLATKPRVMILDEPTQGIDVGAKAEIHALISALAADGAAVILISSDMPEVLGMSDRIAVMRHGRISGTLDRAEATPEKLLALAIGTAEAAA